ncbi:MULTISPECIES: MurR/RpiR family transcriptional regulator [Streptomyces]|uniref:MurR/RpiR family transcriptional regulator n=2 Tax=Streptomyces violaceusniger group TaxID=2839105 RepID=A0ABD5J3T5_9ACTN|nr:MULTISPECIES: MurR/RpiR family transcriptional regulator [Streptomyces]MEE4583018.1 MurR/RpiR family transcriptional regulator [Streptomyces sp. DSM 41602]KUL47252.1 RpiR family transcriptional regulator [Streptomyces violaceusniger]QTI88062.1 MurR/RpiR family transcriptional regulator [Streptomyces sp. AgN23]RSS39541.1 MurR/RpiR family transcriptional regulator [Streptomyces sp. WAC05858]WTA80358.1 MurR/RpiR family transcriptional regulator [Streptomyces antimycoticus]
MARQEPPPRTSGRLAEDASPAGILARIRAALPSLAPSERRVAEAVLGDPGQASELSISALGERAATSVATVMRFCRAVGVSNYPQLRLALAAAAAHERARGNERPVPGTDIGAADTLADIIDKIVYTEVRALEDTGSGLDVDVLSRAVDAVAKGRRIDIFGVGASAFVGQDLHQKLHRIGHMAFVWTDQHAALTATALLGPGDVAVAISHSGETEDTIDPLRAAGERGATTIALTNAPRSTLARSADLVLTTCARETPFRSGATVSRIAQLAVIDCLFVGVAQRSSDEATEALEKTHRAVQGHRRPHTQRRTKGDD